MAMQCLLCQPQQIEHRATTPRFNQSQTDLLPDARLEVQTMPNGKELYREQVLRVHRRLSANDWQPVTRQTAKPEPLKPDDGHQALHAADEELRQLPQLRHFERYDRLNHLGLQLRHDFCMILYIRDLIINKEYLLKCIIFK